MRQLIAAEHRKTRRRLLLIISAVIAAITLTAYALVNLLKTKPSALSTPVNGLEQVGAWISGEEYFFLPLVLLLLTKILIDSRRTIRSSN
jgi:hypothetical protein